MNDLAWVSNFYTAIITFPYKEIKCAPTTTFFQNCPEGTTHHDMDTKKFINENSKALIVCKWLSYYDLRLVKHKVMRIIHLITSKWHIIKLATFGHQNLFILAMPIKTDQAQECWLTLSLPRSD